jgi:chromosome partitioning protein
VGKTTTAVTLAHGLAAKNYTTLLVDLDPQVQCASHLGMDQEDGVFNLLVNRPPMRDVARTTGRPNLWLLPGSKRSKTAEGLMVIERAMVSTLGKILRGRLDGGVGWMVSSLLPAARNLPISDFMLSIKPNRTRTKYLIPDDTTVPITAIS